ncbi:MAG: M23 family metallopeptidase, partial [Candidatus Eisenbacteria bacterium]
APLPASSVITGGFGEIRSNHFHAGLDFSTGGRVGVEVRSPLSGWVERIRSSGVGYGRSIYLHTEDGRLLVFGHLDAYAPVLAAFVDSVQRASGQYEQDVFPERDRFRFKSGDLLAWTGSSGAGGPHMHLEVRRVDLALSPLRAGFEAPDNDMPRLISLTLEPIDSHSWVERRASPLTRTLRETPDTILVEGRVRSVVHALDALAGHTDLPIWSVSLRSGAVDVEARLDSISWDGEMSQIDLLVDRGRIAGTGGWVLWAPAGFRPRFLRTSAPDSLEAGTIAMHPGDAPRPVALRATDAAGNTVERVVVLRAPGANETGPDTTRVGAGRPLAELQWMFSALPDRNLRVRVAGAPAGLRQVRIERGREGRGATAATWDGTAWVAVLEMNGIPDEEGFWIKGVSGDGKAYWQRGSFRVWPAGTDMLMQADAAVSVGIGVDQVFEPLVSLTRMLPLDPAPGGGRVAVAPTLQWLPADLPIRRPVRLVLGLPPGIANDRVSIYRRDGAGRPWEFMRARYDSVTHGFLQDVPQLGEFALLRDDVPPVVKLAAPPRRVGAAAYSRWTLRAEVSDSGSGVEGRESHFRVDGGWVPSEYDSEEGELRWRPLVPPLPGRHSFEVVVTDRAGLRTVKRGSFVLDSTKR